MLNAGRNFFGNEIPVRLATSEILPSSTTRGYNITGLHVIDVRSLLQGSRLPRPSSSTTEDSFEDLALEPLFLVLIFRVSPGSFLAFFIKCGPVSLYISIIKIIGGSALENSDGVNLPVGWGDSILSGVVCRLVVLVCLSSGGVSFVCS